MPWAHRRVFQHRSVWPHRQTATRSPVSLIFRRLPRSTHLDLASHLLCRRPVTRTKNGTSMAAPHVAGAVAIFRQVKPSATVTEIRNLLATNGPNITDNRTSGSVTKRRLDVYSGLCDLITCDVDDYRTLLLDQPLNGTISPSDDRDHYFLFGVAGQQVTIELDRTSGNLDPYLELYNPSGVRVVVNNNSGSGSNALINGRTLQQTGRYQIVARGVGGTGGYRLRSMEQSIVLNPRPSITSLSPASATGTFSGSDFWVQIRGRNFSRASRVYWNGSSRSVFYSSPTRIWIRVQRLRFELSMATHSVCHGTQSLPGRGHVRGAGIPDRLPVPGREQASSACNRRDRRNRREDDDGH